MRNDSDHWRLYCHKCERITSQRVVGLRASSHDGIKELTARCPECGGRGKYAISDRRWRAYAQPRKEGRR